MVGRNGRLHDIRVLKLAEMYEMAFERFVLDVSQRYVEDEAVRARLAGLLDPADAHARRIAAELDRLNRTLGPADRAGVERAALLDILDVERAAREFYFRSLGGVEDPAVADLFRGLAHEESEHVRIAEEALALADRRRGRISLRQEDARAASEGAVSLWEGTSDLSARRHAPAKGAHAR